MLQRLVSCKNTWNGSCRKTLQPNQTCNIRIKASGSAKLIGEVRVYTTAYDVVPFAIGVKGNNNNGVYAFNVPRRDPINEGGMQLTPVGPMGVATAINFQPTGGGKAAITGDFVLTGNAVNPVITALRSNGIEVTALHSHMLDEQPRLFFMHFWANDDAIKLAKGLRAALDKTASTKS